ncbi:MAG: hypothetical protein E7405_06025 [Ruminococcaceae bacterium]|nr:hypothetical protein [Oscillospiraceae bacterium]
MKKYISLLPLLICLALAGCSHGNKNTPPRVRDTSGCITDNGSGFYSNNMDLDHDGENETITMEVVTDGKMPWEASLNITAGEFSTSLPMIDGMIDAVYSCDIDTEDGVSDLAIITNEVSDDPRIRIIKYAENMPLYQFNLNDEVGINDELWLGYAISYYFNILENDQLVLEMQTPSYGMWSVYRYFQRNENGVFEEVIKEHYDILPDFMERAYTKDFSEHELDMWQKGYITAHCDYKYEDFEIKEGEFFKPLYDDGKNKLFVEKENGTDGWISLDYAQGYDPSMLNPNFFFLAG